MKTIKIAHLYYDLMNLYGENGNVRFLKYKLEEQDIKTEIHFLSIDDKIDFNKYDFYYIGTGSHENQELVLNDISKYKDDIKKAIDDNKYFLVTGDALELFGNKIISDENETDALEIFDFETKNEEFRIVGEQFYETDLINQKIIGFQNRDCVMTKVDTPLFSVIKGTGFNPNENNEGIKKNNFYGSYLLGPILVRNPYLTDCLVKQICKENDIKYKKPNYDDECYKAYSEYLKNFHENQE